MSNYDPRCILIKLFLITNNYNRKLITTLDQLNACHLKVEDFRWSKVQIFHWYINQVGVQWCLDHYRNVENQLNTLLFGPQQRRYYRQFLSWLADCFHENKKCWVEVYITKFITYLDLIWKIPNIKITAMIKNNYIYKTFTRH